MIKQNKKILVTGGTGLVGSYLLRKLTMEGFNNIVAIHRRSSSFNLIDDYTMQKVRWIECDVQDETSLENILSEIDIVVHCAGLISFWPKEYEKMFDINYKATKRLVDLSKKRGVSHFIHISSVEALGQADKYGMITETSLWDESKSLSQYAISKYLGERAVAQSRIPFTTLNPGFILGGGNWLEGPLKLITDIYRGLRFYPAGSIGLVDVRDVAEVVFLSINNQTPKSDQFIVVAENVFHKEYFRIIADYLKVRAANIKLREPLSSLAITIEYIKSRIFNTKPLINRETLNIVSQRLQYSNEKLKREIPFEFRTIDETIREVCECFLSTFPKGLPHGILDV